jgi:hypothetical protein
MIQAQVGTLPEASPTVSRSPASGRLTASRLPAFVHDIKQQADVVPMAMYSQTVKVVIEGQGAVRVNAQQGPQQPQQPQQADGVRFPDFFKLVYHRYFRP